MTIKLVIRYIAILSLIIFLAILNIDLINKLNIKNTKWLLSSNPFEQSRIELIEDFNENETLTLSFQTKIVFFDQNMISEIESFTNKLKSSNELNNIPIHVVSSLSCCFLFIVFIFNVDFI